MAKYEGTYTCGHNGVVNIVGPTKDREWKRQYHFSGLCQECHAKKIEQEREQQRAEAQQKAIEMDLPELKGSEKQVGWAITIRQQRIDSAQEIIEESKKYSAEDQKIIIAIYDCIFNKTDAKWWIDTRAESTIDLFRDEQIKMNTKPADKITDDAAATITPENQTQQGVVEISIEDKTISLYYQRNETFIDMVKKYRFKWDTSARVWRRTVDRQRMGSVDDRAAEIGNKLLNAGFAVLVRSEIIKDKIINADYEIEYRKWVVAHKNNKDIILLWDDRSDELYKAARRITGSRWDGNVIVPVSSYKQILDFAERYGFNIDDNASELINKYEQALAPAVTPVEPVKPPKEKERLENIMQGEVKVIEDLSDE